MTASAHNIQQLSLEVEVRGVSEAAASQWPDKLRAWLEADLLPKLELVLDDLLPRKNAVIRLDLLSLDLGQFRGTDFEKISAEQIRASLAKAIEGLNASEENPVKGKLESFRYFLLTGRLPWWADEDLDFENWTLDWLKVIDNQRFGLHDFRSVLSSPNARQRLAASFSPKFKFALANGLLFADVKKSKVVSPEPIPHFSPTQDTLSSSFWASIFELISRGETAQAQQMLEGKPLPEDLKIPKETIVDKLENKAPVPTPIYVKNAGVVLLHPFLEMFFEATGVAKDGQLFYPEKAAQLLHQLAVGRVGTEYEMPLNKLLCGMHPDSILDTTATLSDAEKQECGTLLNAVIRHWSALGDSSVEGLQGSFLCRDGKLTKRQDGAWLLQVEQRGYDMLLDQLPWNISMVKLPWMLDMLWVEWR